MKQPEQLRKSLADFIHYESGKISDIMVKTVLPGENAADSRVEEALRLWPHLQERRVGDAGNEELYKIERLELNRCATGLLRTPLNHPCDTVVLTLHGHMRGAFLGKEGAEYCAVPLAKMGIATLAVDLIAFGERRHREYDAMELASGGQMLFAGEKVEFVKALSNGRTLLGMQLSELSAWVTYLKDVRKFRHVMVFGHSMGGIYSFWLGALDSRIDLTVVLAGMLSYEALACRDIGRLHALYCLVPDFVRHFATCDLLKLIAPRGFYGVHASDDEGFPVDTICEMSEMAAPYFPKGRFRSIIMDGDHGDMLSELRLQGVFQDICAFVSVGNHLA